MFDIDDMADNDLFEEPSGTPSEEPQTDPVPPTEDTTKAYSERLKKDREKIRNEEREALAKEFGYDSYEKFRDAHVDNSLLDKGLDPDTVKPLIKDLIKNDPEYVEAMRFKAEKEDVEKNIWAKDEIKKLNDKFGLKLTDISELDEDTVKLWNGGLSLDKAYAKEQDSGKTHLNKPEGTGKTDTDKVVVTDDIYAQFRAFNPDVTREEVEKYLNRSKK